MSAITTFMPSRTNTFAIARPIPLAPPVINATLSFTSFIYLFLDTSRPTEGKTHSIPSPRCRNTATVWLHAAPDDERAQRAQYETSQCEREPDFTLGLEDMICEERHEVRAYSNSNHVEDVQEEGRDLPTHLIGRDDLKRGVERGCGPRQTKEAEGGDGDSQISVRHKGEHDPKRQRHQLAQEDDA